MRGAGDDPEELRAQPHDRQVGLEAAVVVEDRRVDDAPGLDVELGERDVLECFERAGAGDVEDVEGGQVDHRDPVPHRQVLGVHDRRPPARLPLGLARHHPVAVLLEQLGVRLVPPGALPAGRLEEDGAELLLARVERADADVPVALPLLRRVDDPVGLVEALGGARVDVALLALVRVEAGDVGAVHVDLGGALDGPLGDGACDSRAFLDPDRGHRPEVLHLGRLAEDRHPVRGQREQAVDRVADPGALDA